jgi:hypothetical protein
MNPLFVLRSGLAAVLICLSFAVSAAIQLVPLVSGLSSPDFVGNAGDGTGRLFIVERGGIIRVLQPGASAPTAFLDVRAKLTSGGLEQGLLGLAFHPRYAANGRFFIFYTRAGDGALVISQFSVSPTNRDVAATAETILLTIPHPTNTNHNGGMLAFGPDGYLYIGVGDGGAGNDPPNNAQNTQVLLGKILRIDVDHPNASTGAPYSSPPDNPFVNRPGLDEIFALGMRNPWRFSFDRATGQQWVGDVGQGAREEVDTPIVNGGNYGWRVYEGAACTGIDPGLCNPANYLPPLFDYAHGNGRCSITGGYVYRGTRGALPSGTYVYADYCSGEIFAWDGSTQSLLLDTAQNIASFGEDEQGELYVVGLGGTISRIAAPAVATTTALSSSANPAVAGVSVTFTATVAGNNPTGNVSFADGGASIAGCGAVPLGGSGNARTATCTTSALAVGPHSIVATYGGDTANAGSASAALAQVINTAGGGALVNSSFENPALGGNLQYAPTGANVGWTFVSAGVQGNGSAMGAAAAPKGTQTAFVQGAGSISQSVNLNAGSYVLTLQVARRAYSNPPGAIAQPVRVTIDGAQIGGLIIPPGTGFTPVTIAFSIATSGAHTLQFAGTDGSGDKSTFLDDVTIVPGSAPMMLINAGFEMPALGGKFQYAPTGANVGWSFSSAGVQGNGSAFGAASAPEGTQTAFIQGAGTIGQAVSLNPGNYVLTLQVARRSWSVPSGAVQPLRVTVDGVQIGGLITPPGTGFTPVSIPFSIAAAGAHALQFAGTDATGDKSTFIDNVAIGSAAIPNTLANTSFEAPVVGNGFAYGPTGANVGWTFASAGVQGNGSAWGAAVAPNGSQTAFIQQTGTISQTFNLDPGNYTLALQVARRNYSVPAGSAQPIRVTIDGTQIGSLVTPPSTAFTPIAIPFSIATSGMHTLVFTGTDASGDKSTFIDAVTIGP